MPKIKAFAVCDAGYIDPAIIALSSFMKYNPGIPVAVYVEAGINYKRLARALRGYPVEFREAELPQLPEHQGVKNPYSDLFFKTEALPAYAQRIKALEEMRAEADFIVNIDLDTLTRNGIAPLFERGLDRACIYGVNERKNRDRWISSLGVKDITAGPVYINTGFVIYGRDALPADLFLRYREFLKANGPDLFCPEQDFINYALADRIRAIPNNYNMMFTAEDYTRTAPVIIHYLGSAKPWSDAPQTDPRMGYYFRLYRRIAEQEPEVAPEFMQKIARNT